MQRFSENGSIKQWHKFMRDYNLHKRFYFQWLQLIDSMQERYKFIIKKNYENATTFIIHNKNYIRLTKIN